MNTADDVTTRLLEIYGEEPTPAAGVIHVTAVWEDPDRELRALRICDRTPPSATDAFLLGVARARSDVIVTTGASLRAEPGLQHSLDGLRRPGAALSAWRRERMGRRDPPCSCILTASGQIDLRHRLFRDSPHTTVYTRPSAVDRLERKIAEAGLENVDLVADENSSLARAVAHLKDNCGFETVDIEAGPSAASTLYYRADGTGSNGDSGIVDELMLSQFEAGTPHAEVRGPALFNTNRLNESFSRSSQPYIGKEESGRWSFRRYLR
jgi:riboflavin biosynthesis pyrimidine reductase